MYKTQIYCIILVRIHFNYYILGIPHGFAGPLPRDDAQISDIDHLLLSGASSRDASVHHDPNAAEIKIIKTLLAIMFNF